MPFVGLDCAMTMGTTGATAFDRIATGEIGFDQSLEHMTGAGGDDSVVYSMIEPKGSAETWLQTMTLLNSATKSANNALPAQIAQIDGGVLGEAMKKQTECYLNSTKLSCEIGGAVKAAYDWLALGHTTSAVTVGATAKAKNLMLLWHAGAVVLGGATFACQSWESTIEHGLKLHTSQDDKAAGAERYPEAITPGNQKVSLTAEFKTAPTIDFLVAIPATVAFVFSATNTEGSPKTFIHTVSGLHPVGMPQKVAAGEDDVTWSIDCEADFNDLTAWAASLG